MKRLLIVIAALCVPPAAFSQDDKSPPPPTADDTASLPRAAANDEAEVRKLLGQKAVITGKVTNSYESAKVGMTFIDLDGGKFTVVCWKDSYGKFTGGSPAKLYPKGKSVEVNGVVSEYKGKGGKDAGKLQIKLAAPEQVRIVEAEAAPKKDSEKTGKAKDKDSAAKPDSKQPSEPKPAPDKDKERVDSKKFFK